MKPRQRGLSLAFSTRRRSPALGRYVRHLRRTAGVRRLQVLVQVNPGRQSLPEVYNGFLAQARHETLCLLHDDLRFARNRRWGRQILQAFARHPDYAVFSAAGSVSLDSHGVYWLPPQDMLGRVSHRLGGKIYPSTYCPEFATPLPALVLDGLLLALQRARLQARFDEALPGFHFYDIAFSLQQALAAQQQGAPGCGVLTRLGLTHLSPGRPDAAFEALRQRFCQRYAAALPARLPLPPRYTSQLPGLAPTTPPPRVALWLWHHQPDSDPEALRQLFAQSALPPQEVCLFAQTSCPPFGGPLQPVADWADLQQALLAQAAASTAEYLLLLDTRVWPWQDWLPALLRRFRQHPQLGLLGVRLHYADTGAVYHAGLAWVLDQGVPVDVALRGIHSPFGYRERLEPGLLGCSGVWMLRRQHFIDWGGWYGSAWLPGFALGRRARAAGWDCAVDGQLAGAWQAGVEIPDPQAYAAFVAQIPRLAAL